MSDQHIWICGSGVRYFDVDSPENRRRAEAAHPSLWWVSEEGPPGPDRDWRDTPENRERHLPQDVGFEDLPHDPNHQGTWGRTW